MRSFSQKNPRVRYPAMGNYSETELRLGLCTCDKCDIFHQPSLIDRKNIVFVVIKLIEPPWSILQHPIGFVGINLPTYVKRNKSVIGLEKDHHGAGHSQNGLYWHFPQLCESK